MSGQLKEVRLRIQSVSSTQQITKAMKMVSAAKLRKAQDAVTQMRPYAQKLQEMLSNIVSNSSSDSDLSLTFSCLFLVGFLGFNLVSSLESSLEYASFIVLKL
jgi:ATP synthase F1 gamma subunit